MWGIVLFLVVLLGIAMTFVGSYRQAAAMRSAGYRMFGRAPLPELPPPVRRRLQRAILRGEPVPAELLPNARNWANYIVVASGRQWTYFWLAVTLAALLVETAFTAEPAGSALFFTLCACGFVLVVSGLLLWRYRRAAQRLLRDTSPPA